MLEMMIQKERGRQDNPLFLSLPFFPMSSVSLKAESARTKYTCTHELRNANCVVDSTHELNALVFSFKTDTAKTKMKDTINAHNLKVYFFFLLQTTLNNTY